MKTITLFILLSINLLISWCDDGNILLYDDITVVNLSDDTIHLAFEDKFFILCHVAPKDSTSGSDVAIIKNYEEQKRPESELHLLIFKQSTCQKFDEDVLIYNYDARFDYTYTELKKMNFRIVYEE